MRKLLTLIAGFALILVSCTENKTPELDKPLPIKLETPSEFTVNEQSVTSTSMTVQWNALDSSSVASYSVEWKKEGDSEFTAAAAFTNNYTLNDLEHSTLYQLRLKAVSADGAEYDSDYTDNVEAETLIIYVVTPPQNVRVVANKTTSTSILVEWDAVENSIGYQVRCTDTATGDQVTAQTTETSLVVRNLASNTEYSIAVQSLSRSGNNYNSDYSSGLIAKTKNLAGGIFNASDLVAFAQTLEEEYASVGVATGADWANAEGVVNIMADIDMKDITWKPVSSFNGKLNGNGFKITNLVVSTYDSNSGLFATVNGATISNLVIGEGSRISTTNLSGASYAGAIAGTATGNNTFENITSYATITSATSMGGICGAAIQKDGKVVFKGCNNYGEITFPAIQALANVMLGGICGANESGITYEDCTNFGPISNLANGGGKYVQSGGIVGGGTDYTINNCHNRGKIFVDTRNMGTYYVGGIVGRAFRGTVEDASNIGDIVFAPSTVAGGEARIYVAGCFGALEGNVSPSKEIGLYYTYKNISNSANITINTDAAYDSLIGGIIGLLYLVDIELDNLSNSGNMTLSSTITGSGVAGLIGIASSNASSKPSRQSILKNSENTGNVLFTESRSNSAWQNVSGIVGRTTHNNFIIENCVNRGDITMDQTTRGNVGGIVSECKCDVIGCENYGTIYVTDSHVDYYSGAAGIVARLNAAQVVKGCKNYGTIIYNGKGFKNANPNKGLVGQGGIVGIQYKGSVENCENYGTVLGNDYDASHGMQSYLNAKGSIVGWGGNDAQVTISGCKVGGAIGSCVDTDADMGVSKATVITADNYSNYIYGGNAKNGVSVSGCSFAQ